jgi:hypothetical protein
MILFHMSHFISFPIKLFFAVFTLVANEFLMNYINVSVQSFFLPAKVIALITLVFYGFYVNCFFVSF